MAYLATLGDQEFHLEVQADERDARVRLGEREIVVDVISVNQGLYSLLIDGSSYEVDVLEGQEALVVLVRGQAFPVAIRPRQKRRRETAAKGYSRDGRWAISAPMAGRVVRHLVRVGEAVEAADGVTVLEAMKMESVLTAPVAGRVTEIRIPEGMAVKSGEVLVLIEEVCSSSTSTGMRVSSRTRRRSRRDS